MPIQETNLNLILDNIVSQHLGGFKNWCWLDENFIQSNRSWKSVDQLETELRTSIWKLVLALNIDNHTRWTPKCCFSSAQNWHFWGIYNDFRSGDSHKPQNDSIQEENKWSILGFVSSEVSLLQPFWAILGSIVY